MMFYTQVDFLSSDTALHEILIAVLSDAGYEGFMETNENLQAYIPEEKFNAVLLTELSTEYNIPFSISRVEQQNWNAVWESNFQPVVVDDFCTVRADFHKTSGNTAHEIIITPKMSFGTGHHATTRLMIQQMRKLNFADKRVLDLGTGTGILAILAEKLGAEHVVAIDNDEWAFENSKENIKLNACKRVHLLQGTLEDAPVQGYDIILANINRHVLLHYMQQLYNRLGKNGSIVMSGILTEDRSIIVSSAEHQSFRLADDETLDNWMALAFEK